MTEPRDEFDAWRDRHPVEPMSPRPGAFERIDTTARHRRRMRFAGGGAAVVVVVLGAALLPGFVRQAYQSKPPGQVTVVPETHRTSGGASASPSVSSSGATTDTPRRTGSAPSEPTHRATGRESTGRPTGAPVPSGSATLSDTPKSTPRCHTADLSATVAMLSGGAGAGQRYAKVVFANTSDHVCAMRGSIGMQLYAAGGSLIQTHVTWSRQGSATRVTMLPNGHAVTLVKWTRIPSGPSDCGTDPATVKIIPPNERTQLTASWPGGPVCGHGALQTVPVIGGTNPPSL